jgi:transposase InsO family protein
MTVDGKDSKKQSGWMYLAAILDPFSGKVVGLSMAESLETSLITKALKQALLYTEPKGTLMHHSNRGCQYTSKEFKELTQKYGINLSMSAKGRCYDNAVAESFFHTLKTEHTKHCNFRNREEAKTSIAKVCFFLTLSGKYILIAFLEPLLEWSDLSLLDELERSCKKLGVRNLV